MSHFLCPAVLNAIPQYVLCQQIIFSLLKTIMPVQNDPRQSTPLYKKIAGRHACAELFVSNCPSASVILCLQRGRCRLIFREDCIADQIAGVFAQAVQAGYRSARYCSRVP
jgi:hypothetical protein